MGQLLQVHEKLERNIQNVIVGKAQVVKLMHTAMLCSGHVLLEDIPGTGKTMLAKALAKSMASSFSRVQFTPDLLPSDLTGLNFFNQQKGGFEFRKGPLMANIVLADEINRATPRTQAALLEAMAEEQITVDGTTYKLEAPFLVVATQNPIETGGTFPLPEAQLDRFFMQLSMGYPSREEEAQILERFEKVNPLDHLEAVVVKEELLSAREAVKQVRCSADVRDYLLTFVAATRTHEMIDIGISPRGTMALYNGAKAWAALSGRDFVKPDDIQVLAVPVLAHRLKLKEMSYQKDFTAQGIIETILKGIEVPVESRQAL